MAEPVEERKSKQVSFQVSAEQWDAIAFVGGIHGAKYDGVAPVLMDYSVNECVALHQRALARAGTA